MKSLIKKLKKNQLDDKDLNDDSFKVMYVGSIRTVNDVGSLLDAAKLLKEINKLSF